MSAILLLCQCDSVATKLVNAAIPVVQQTYEAGTQCEDVEIAKIICCSIVSVVAICTIGYLVWSFMNLYAKKKADERKHKWEVEECDRKQEAEKQEKEPRRKADLLKELKEVDKNSYIYTIKNELKKIGVTTDPTK